MKYSTVLSIAGSDSGGGAGIQADIKAISACGGYAATAITAITVQNTVGVSNVHPIPPQILEEQIEAVLSDIGANAIKIGMLHSAEIIDVVCRALDRYAIENVVLDPVMVATSGDILLQNEALTALREKLIPKARIITPNIPEAEILLDAPIAADDDLPRCAAELADRYQVSVLLKAGHLDGDTLTDVLYDFEKKENLLLQSERIRTRNTHGTGCTLSSSLAAFLARGFDLQDAVQRAKAYISHAIIGGAAYEIGSGHGPVKHFHEMPPAGE
ncbi:bifunctional hydroxymethylpyrimidine kinase/phosphomethylpyrimidine kinase [Pontiella agarivorans]|uniref:hydroxymethylpyrimidine kinase n=1 Tax=Pontiella agarivorans TaxID=3038953 RepID=A0ABU5N0E9_9BACT|nr:bifunctional hydroxymethylpyrimidine kinase/phosphomethylpyrimidine kinase [Pontiella agarivorans]MDZ8119924.1 bifunctional hydroxymethylpyrimidine kinase/phosphomethylpyrimidine kinase [Pontiella agarivorans]